MKTKERIVKRESNFNPNPIYLILVTISFLLCQMETDINRAFVRGVVYFSLVFTIVIVRDMKEFTFQTIFWNFVKIIGFSYCLCLIFLFSRTLEEARMFISHFDPSLAQDLPEKTYAASCVLYNQEKGFQDFWASFDVFIIIHVISWLAITVAIREAEAAVFIGITFELCELSLAHWFPNFNECWFDSIILDLLVFNNVGIVLGMLFIKVFKLETFKFFSLFDKENRFYFAKDTEKYLSTLIFLAVLHTVLLNSFFVKKTFHIPSEHILHLGRVLLVILVSCKAGEEWYNLKMKEDRDEGKSRVFGAFSLLTLLIIFAEIAVYVKLSVNIFVVPTPPLVSLFWSIVAVVLLVGYFVVNRKRKTI